MIIETEIGNLHIGDIFIFDNVKYRSLSATGYKSVCCISETGKIELFSLDTIVKYISEGV